MGSDVRRETLEAIASAMDGIAGLWPSDCVSAAHREAAAAIRALIEPTKVDCGHDMATIQANAHGMGQEQALDDIATWLESIGQEDAPRMLRDGTWGHEPAKVEHDKGVRDATRQNASSAAIIDRATASKFGKPYGATLKPPTRDEPSLRELQVEDREVLDTDGVEFLYCTCPRLPHEPGCAYGGGAK